MLLESTERALSLLTTYDPELWGIVGISFSVSFIAMGSVLFPALLLSFGLAYGQIRGKWLILSLINTLQSVPTVVIGLTLYLLLFSQVPWEISNSFSLKKP